MLTFGAIDRERWYEVATLSPNDYLRWWVRHTFETHIHAYEVMEKLGLRAVLRETYVEIECTDHSLFLASLPAEMEAEARAHLLKRMREWTPRDPGDALSRFCLGLCDVDEERRLRNVPVGFAAVPWFNAGAGPVPAGGEVVLLQDGLWGLEYALAHFKALTDSNGDKWSIHSRALIDWVRVFNKVPSTVPVSDPPSFGESDERGFQALVEILLSFVLLHEYGHILLGHVDGLRSAPPEWTLSQDQLRRQRVSMRQAEIAADVWAVRKLQRAFKGNANWSLILLVHLFAFLHVAASCAPATDPRLASHPSARRRLRAVLGAIQPSIPELSAARALEDVWYVAALTNGVAVRGWRLPRELRKARTVEI